MNSLNKLFDSIIYFPRKALKPPFFGGKFQVNLARLFHEDHEIAASSSQLISGSPYAMELLQRFKAGRSFSGLSVADVLFLEDGNILSYT